MSEYHVPVLRDEVMEVISPGMRDVIVDCTLGGGGHTSEMMRLMRPSAHLYGIDKDDAALEEAGRRIEREYSDSAERFTAIKGSFFNARELLAGYGVDSIDAALCDLGVSSHQLDDAERGFSHRFNARLDMRMDRKSDFSAYDVVNGYSEADLRRILYDYGEEKYAPAIARNIVRRREQKPIEMTSELVEIIRESMPQKVLRQQGSPFSRTFQALRIETNHELDGLGDALRNLVDMLNPGGVLAVITFHSLEDRVVKNLFRELHDPCTCPKSAPVCICGKKPVVDVLLKKPVTAGDKELEENPRARSAKLRAVVKL